MHRHRYTPLLNRPYASLQFKSRVRTMLFDTEEGDAIHVGHKTVSLNKALHNKRICLGV